MRAFAFFFEYHRLLEESPEAAYNVGRAFHFVGLLHHAADFYNRVLASAHRGHVTLAMEAAHNLSIIYK